MMQNVLGKQVGLDASCSGVNTPLVRDLQVKRDPGGHGQDATDDLRLSGMCCHAG